MKKPPASRKQPVAVFGLGAMGIAYAQQLIDDGFSVLGIDPSSAARQRLNKLGGHAVTRPESQLRDARVVLSALPSTKAFYDVIEQLIRFSRRDTVLIETSTLSLQDKLEARTQLAKHGIKMLDAPVSGTRQQALMQDIVIYVSGSRSSHDQVADVLTAISRWHPHVGKFGNGIRLKLIANLLVAIHNAAAAEALVLAKKSGLDPAASLELLGAGAAASKMLELRGPQMVKNQNATLMSIDLWEKDLSIIEDFARSNGCLTPLLSVCRQLHLSAMAQGLGAQDIASVHAVLAKASGLK